MQKISAWIILVVITVIVAVADPRSLISVIVCVVPVCVAMIAAPESRRHSEDSVQSKSIEK